MRRRGALEWTGNAFRRGTCDRGIWTKSLAFAADAEELIFLYGFSMAVSPFDRLKSARSQIVEKRRCSTAKPIIAQNTNLVAEKIAVPRTRDSVRRASGFVQMALSFIEGGISATAWFL